MTENKKATDQGTLSLDQLVRQLDNSLKDANDPQALRLGMAALAGYDPGEQREKYILIALGGERLAIPIGSVAEVGDLPTTTRLPNVPDWLLGIINVRSEIISVMDLCRFLELDEAGSIRGNRMIIVQRGAIKVALKIDRVLGTYNKTEDTETVVARLKIAESKSSLLTHGMVIQGKHHYVLDCEGLLANEQFIEAK